MRATVPVLLALAMAAAGCQQQPTASDIRTGEGMVDPATGVLDPAFVDGTFALSVILEERLERPLNNSDRRAIDAALDETLSDAPDDPAARWTNELRDHSGSVDLVSWRIDRRAGELCGVIEHRSLLEDPLAGAITICRANIDPAWRVDEVVWKEAAASRPERQARREPPPRETPPRRRTEPRQPEPVVRAPEVNYGPGSDIPPEHDPQPTGRVAAPVTGGGATTLGDALASPSAN
jgi:hypothetical protein